MKQAHEKQVQDEAEAARLAQEFAQESNLDRLKQIAVALSRPGLTSKAARHQAFEQRLNDLLVQARSGVGSDRLKAIALVGRLRQQAKVLSGQIRNILTDLPEPIDAQPADLQDPTDRAYLARMLREIPFPRRDHFLAAFIASEPPTRTDARNIATAALLESTPSLSVTFELLSQELRARTYETQEPAISKARQLLRTLESLADALRQTDAATDSTLGVAYAKLILHSLQPYSDFDRKTSTDITRRALEILVLILRQHFSLVQTPDTFEVVRAVKRLFYPGQWPRETAKPREEAIGLLREAIALLARTGVTDSRLRQVLVLLSDERTAAALLKQIALDTHGIQNDVKHWLETGRAPATLQSSESISETILEMVDRDIARVFRDAMLLTGGDTFRQAGVANEASSDFRDRVDMMARDAERLARARSLKLKYDVGDIVEYSPAEHELDRPISGTRLVRILSPQVIRVQEGRSPRIILKAQVAPEGGA